MTWLAQPTRSALSCKFTAPLSCSRTNPAEPFSEAIRSIEHIDWNDANNKLDR